jgi:uncharacterized protein (TIGR00290 family)
MDLKKKVTISWSGGKDSAFALYKVMLSGEFSITSLHTVINEETRRVGMHGVAEALIERQAEALGLPLTKLYLESSESHDAYSRLMTDYYQRCADNSIDAVVFGDIFLEDLKAFRENLLRPSGLEGIYPLWKIDTAVLMADFINAGFKTMICAANAAWFPASFAGSTIDHALVTALPAGVDPCGENGEFHTLVYDGPLFRRPVALKKGEVIRKTYSYQKVNDAGATEPVETAFWFQDLFS